MKTWVLVRGGLGNQMFQVAYGAALKARYGAEVAYVDFSQDARVKRDWGLAPFGIERVTLSPARWRLVRWVVIGARRLQDRAGLPVPDHVWVEPEVGGWRPWPRRAPWLVDGYWQQVRYLEGMLPTLRRLFAVDLRDHGASVTAWRQAARPLVALHARRGDYVSDPAAAMHLVCDVGYYRRAWEHLRQSVPDARLVVFSDDPQWARANLQFAEDMIFATPAADQPAWVDMMRMRACDHFIISNSSYSWWAAFLAEGPDKRVVAPDHWLVGVPTSGIGICPEDWTLLR
ncbi:hypothetical protein GTZ97_02095 [Aquabacterium fontiphilum]|uniref:alpha-1,2-fucosyltransferase n=1 Tax=Aquabacterium fontiphilum TaxID=450365 RepID=UPI0013771C9F|nr:alpha-1,2-fucosyltransferase [Aquabacterium fontiphilum]NBD19465.1 hypothetical protein [Aquabacterium fontiphilum]